ncbi:MAG: hypothetical protein AB7G13_24515 [Lautropia sp.]
MIAAPLARLHRTDAPYHRPATALLATALGSLLIGGCASLYAPVNQEVAIRAVQNDERVEASCEVGNELGRWSVVAPTEIGVTRSDKPLTVDCRGADGAGATRVFQATREASVPFGSAVEYAYPGKLVVPLPRGNGPASNRSRVMVEASQFAPIDDVARVPNIDDAGREGYRRFLAGESPRAFAVAESGRWVRVNGARGADRVALDRCTAEGSHCKLYAVDDLVVWDRKRANDLLASN